MEEELAEHLHKVRNSRFTMSHLSIKGLATARAQLGVSIYGNHMLAEDVWVRRFQGEETEAVVHDFEEAQAREER